jgi:SAM-dependent methyltransferase
VRGVPVLLPHDSGSAYLDEAGGAMFDEYSAESWAVRLRRRVDDWVYAADVKPPALRDAINENLWGAGSDALVLSVGGGPGRWGAETNLNIGAFPNVDIVGDAYSLPYADAAVDAVLCWAVLEHLEFPDRAVAEIARVLEPNGIVLFGTPFLQAFHAYPNHFQNLTLVGHERMVQRVGLEVVQSGAIGQTSALVDLTSVYLRSFLPGRVVPGVIARCLRVLSRVLAPIDRALARRADAHIVASNVWVLARRPV